MGEDENGRSATVYVVLEEVKLQRRVSGPKGGGQIPAATEDVTAQVELGRQEARSRRDAISRQLDGQDAGKRLFRAVPESSWRAIRRKPPRQVAAGFEDVEA